MSHIPESIITEIKQDEQLVLSRLENNSKDSVVNPDPSGLEVYNSVAAAVQVAAAQRYGAPEDLEVAITTPPQHVGDGVDLAIPMFSISPFARRNPQQISSEIVESMNGQSIDSVETLSPTGPYINVQLDRPGLYQTVLEEVLRKDGLYGYSQTLGGEIVQIDYSSPNIAKRLGLQHAPTTIVGEALARINNAAGAQVIRSNHLGDYGTPFGKVLVGLEKYGDAAKLAADPVAHMHEVYVRVNQESKTDESVSEAARQAFARLEQGDPATVELWASLREANVKENNALYERLGVHFDTTVGESYFTDSAQLIVDDLVRRGIAKHEDGVVLVPAANNDGIPLVLRKSDGSTLYASRDLAALQYRMQTYNPDKIKYVVGSEQAGQLESVFALAALAKIIPSRQIAEHVRIGLLSDKTGKKLSSREGMTTTFEGVIDTAVQNAVRSLQERYAEQPERQSSIPKLAEILGIGAVSYTILRKDPGANTILEEGTGATRDAGTAGYLQYTHARANSVVQKAEIAANDLLAGPFVFTEIEEWQVLRSVMEFPRSVAKAAESNGPQHVAKNLEDVASAFSKLYQSPDISILNAQGELRTSRVALARAVQIVLRNGLDLLNIKAPEYI